MALARSLFRKGADFTAAMAIEIGSTNLVLEMGIILALLLGWQFTLAEFVGGPIMIVVVALLFRVLLSWKLVDRAREQADRGIAGSMEGHVSMEMAVEDDAPFLTRLFSGRGFSAVANIFVMEWAAILRDLVVGLLIAGAIGAWVPADFWSSLCFAGHPVAAGVEGTLVASFSFVCSVGNVPLAVVLWNGGINFGGSWRSCSPTC